VPPCPGSPESPVLAFGGGCLRGKKLHLLLPKVPAGQAHKDVFKTGLACAQVVKPLSITMDRLKQRRDRQVRLADVETYRFVLVARRLHAGERTPSLHGGGLAPGMPIAR